MKKSDNRNINININKNRSLINKGDNSIQILLTVVVLAFFMILPVACGKYEKEKTLPETVEGFNSSDITLAVVDGYIFSDLAEKYYPEAKIMHFDSRENAYKSVMIGNADGVIDDEPIIRAVMRGNDDYCLIDGYVEPADYAFIFTKNEEGEKLCREFSAYVESLRESGELQQLDDKWFGDRTDNKISDSMSDLNGTNGTIRLVYDISNVPFSYMSAGKPVGYDIDLAIGFCREYGYTLEAGPSDFTAMLNGVADGTFDMGCGAITVTGERAEKLYFSEADYSGGASICVRSRNGEQANEVSYPGHSFYRTFIENDNYRLFLRGIGTTILLTVLTVLAGTIMGCIMYILTQRADPIVRQLTKLTILIIRGVPAIMTIMFLYYVYYQDMYLGEIVAAILGFTIVFSEKVYRTIKECAEDEINGDLAKNYRVEYIDMAEFFAALYIRSGKTMWKSYRENVISLIKFTPLAGYIAVNDMTRTVEYFRQNTFEFIMPLTVIAVAYMFIIALVSWIMRDENRPKVKKQVDERAWAVMDEDDSM